MFGSAFARTRVFKYPPVLLRVCSPPFIHLFASFAIVPSAHVRICQHMYSQSNAAFTSRTWGKGQR